jgi:gamma-glutamyltranspeptidase/glutathione hydrolase
MDGDRSVAALSSTLGSGSGVFRHGFQLNNMLGELDVIGPHTQTPGERLPSMMTPTLALVEGQPRFVVGSAGSVRLSGAIVQVLVRVLAGVTVDEAIDRPRLHVDGSTVHVEGGWQEDVAGALRARGWDVVEWAARNLFFGGTSGVELRPDGRLAAAGDPRRGGHGAVLT